MMSESAADSFRWQSFFQHAAQPIFLLNRRRRILFVNRAWETCTGIAFAEARGRVCRRRTTSASDGKDDAIFAACAPPADALHGQTSKVRRRAPGRADWWEIEFLPLAGATELLGIVGAIRVLAGPGDVPFSLPEKLMALRDRQAARYRLEDGETGSLAVHRLNQQARLAAQTKAPVTLLGEAGTGKEWLARAIHLLGPAKDRYFACLDAQKTPAALLGSVLFGPRSRQMALGSVYLREPQCLPREWQSKIADTVRAGENADFPRLVTGFRRDPRLEIEAGRLLEDFYLAVSPVTITIPPLRERLDELPRFIDVLLRRAGQMQPHRVQDVGAEALNLLRAHPWPGNLAELQVVLQDACRRAKTERIEASDLPFHLKHTTLPAERRLPLDALLEQVERRLITLALKLAQNNQTRAAELLEIWRPRLVRRMEKFGLSPKPAGEAAEPAG